MLGLLKGLHVANLSQRLAYSGSALAPHSALQRLAFTAVSLAYTSMLNTGKARSKLSVVFVCSCLGALTAT